MSPDSHSRSFDLILRHGKTVGALPSHSIYVHFPELASWFVVLAITTWSGAIAALARDLVVAATLFTLAIGTTIACCLFAYAEPGVSNGIKAAAYFWMLSALLAWYRVTVFLIHEAFGPASRVAKFFPVFPLPIEKKKAQLVVPGFGEPGVKKGT